MCVCVCVCVGAPIHSQEDIHTKRTSAKWGLFNLSGYIFGPTKKKSSQLGSYFKKDRHIEDP